MALIRGAFALRIIFDEIKFITNLGLHHFAGHSTFLLSLFVTNGPIFQGLNSYLDLATRYTEQLKHLSKMLKQFITGLIIICCLF